jgi:hypothetical protein
VTCGEAIREIVFDRIAHDRVGAARAKQAAPPSSDAGSPAGEKLEERGEGEHTPGRLVPRNLDRKETP